MYEFCDPLDESHKERPLIRLAKGGLDRFDLVRRAASRATGQA